jgi:hypothetical protein
MNDREHMVQMLARQVLSMREPDGRDPRVSPGIENAGHAVVSVEIRGMVDTIRRQIWIDSASINEKVTAEIERQASAVNLDELVARKVRDAMANVEREVETQVRKHIESAVRERLTKFPDVLAKKLSSRLWAEAQKAADEQCEWCSNRAVGRTTYGTPACEEHGAIMTRERP